MTNAQEPQGDAVINSSEYQKPQGGAIANNPAHRGSDSQPSWIKGAKFQSEKKSNGRYVIGSPSGTFKERPRSARQP